MSKNHLRTADVPPVYLIGLMGVDINHPDKEYWKDRYISEYTFREKECHDLLDETIVIIFAELTRFHKTEDECVTLQDKLLYLLKNSGQMKTPPKWGNEKACKDLLDAFEIDDFSKKKREQYDKRSRKNNAKAGRGRVTSVRFCIIVRFRSSRHFVLRMTGAESGRHRGMDGTLVHALCSIEYIKIIVLLYINTHTCLVRLKFCKKSLNTWNKRK